MHLKYALLFTGASCIALLSCDRTVEQEDLELQWKVISNYEEAGFESEMTLVNNGSESLEDDWTLWFSFMRMPDSESVPPEVDLEHINGDFYRLTPGEDYESIAPGEQLSFTYISQAYAIVESDAPDGAYLEFDDGHIVELGDTHVHPFERQEQTDRNPNDEVPVETAELTYEKNRDRGIEFLPGEELSRITPTPAYKSEFDNEFQLTSDLSINYENGLEEVAGMLSEIIEQSLGFEPEMFSGETRNGEESIHLRLDEVRVDDQMYTEGDEAYHISISESRVAITGSDPAGVFYGIQSLRRLLPADPESDEITLGTKEIRDAPGFGYRGLHLDVSRNFQSVESVKRLLDVMAYYKLNKFHFHLTDDEGWRLAIDAFPELTEIGARRGHTLSEEEHLIPSYGSGPNPDVEASMGSGWYSQEEYLELLEYARKRHIEVIPEIDIPGHARAALVAMKNRYERLHHEGMEEEAEQYRIHEPEDESEYRSIQGWDDNVINVCQESTYNFLEVVFDELIAMHREADMPLNSMHVGGDEVPAGAWQDSPVCRELMDTSEEVDSADDLMDYTFNRIEQMLAERGLTLAAWEEFSLKRNPETDRYEPNPEFAGQAIPYVWSNIWGAGTESYSYELANAGYDIVMSHASNFYFDLTYTKHPEEAGLYWAGFVDTPEPFNFIPYNLYKSVTEDAMGHPLPEDTYDDYERLDEEARDNILGLQAQLWAETFREPSRVEYMAIPRIIPFAERAWNPEQRWMAIDDPQQRERARNAEWNVFANRLGQLELTRLDRLNGGYDYRLPPPGAVIENGELRTNVSLPGLEVRYTTDGSEPDETSTVYEEPVQVTDDDDIRLRTFDTRGRGSRAVKINL